MAFFVRLVIGLAGGLVALAMLLVFLAFLVSEPATTRAPASTRAEREAAALVRQSGTRDDFELVGRGVIVPLRAAERLLNQCSRETVSPIEGFWRPTPSMVAELEARLPAFLMYESRLQPLERYVRQYAGVVSRGQPLVYASFVIDPLDEWQRQVVVLCDGGNLAWGVAFDVERKTFGAVGINGDGGAPAAPAAVADAWLGRWMGPEGTFLLLEGGDGSYRVTIQNLDGPRTFAGVGAGAQIHFERDGMMEQIHATDGAATGMKWLADKRDCLTVRSGEGYCRD